MTYFTSESLLVQCTIFWNIITFVYSSTHLSSNHHRTTWARRHKFGSPDRNSRGRCSPAGTAMPPYPFDCNPLLSSPFYRCTCPRRRNRGPSKSDADSRPLRSTSLCSRVHSCICRWCNDRGRCSRVHRTRRVARSTLCLSSRDCIDTHRLYIRLNRDDGIICWRDANENYLCAQDSRNWFRL